MDEESNCGNCYFWEKYGDHGLGQCRIKPPVAVTGGEWYGHPPQINLAIFPIVKESCWCGEFRHKNRMP